MPKTIAILDYGAGNLTSIRLAFEHLGANPVVTADATEAGRADAIVFPGVGSARSGMDGLLSRGLDRPVRDALRAGRPVLAICLGMQMCCSESEEDGGVAGLGLVPGHVALFRFPVDGTQPVRPPKVPHMGWNRIAVAGKHPVFDGLDGEAFYFVHSYYVDLLCPATCAVTEYGGKDFASAIASGSLVATQFHPERSGEAGLRLLRNFLDWEPAPCC